MKNLSKNLSKNFGSVAVSLVLTLSQAASAAPPEAVTDRRSLVRDLTQRISALQKGAGLPGLHVIVTEGEKTIFEYLHGVRALGQSEAITAADKWHIGSCTKPMTAFLIGRLVDAKSVTWKTTLAELAPKDYQLAPSLRAVTVEQLLSHSSGLADVTAPDGGKLWPTLFTDKIQPEVAREKLVRGILQMPARFRPGSKVEYSNSGYIVLGWIVERLRGESWEASFKKEVLARLGMKSCGFGSAGTEDIKMAKQPWPHHFADNRLVAISPGIQSDNPPALGPAGRVHCSVRDWHKFLQLFMENEGVRSKFLTQATYDKLLSRADDDGYTFSSVERLERTWAKGTVFAMAGSNTFNYAFVAVAPVLKRIITINTNAGHAKAEESVMEVLKLLVELK